MGFYAGVDLGKRKSQIKVIGPDRKVEEELRVSNDPQTFKRIFAKYRGNIEVACEATANAFWVADVLEPIVKKVHVGDTKKIRWIAEARIKTDRIDAGILAELLRADLFPSIHIPPRRIRDLRELVRGQIRLRRQAARARNQVHGLLGRQGVPYQRNETGGDRLGELVGEAKLPAPARAAAEAYLKMEQAAGEEAKRLEREIRTELGREPELSRQIELLESIPGIGMFSATLLVLEIWDIKRFPDAAHLASYLGFVPSTYQTGESAWNGRLTKQGNALIRWILVEDAWVASRHNLFFGKRYERYRARLGKSRAIIPVARALLATIHRVWTLGKSYEEIYGSKPLAG